MALYKCLIEQKSQQSDRAFSLLGDQTLLAAMHDQQLPVRKACRNGGCGVCRCRLTRGDITYHQREPFALWQADIDAGVILPCIAYAVSDVVLSELSYDAKALREHASSERSER